MRKRCIMIFPEFDNMSIIDSIRNEYDPLCRLVKPHITLVFPFESDIPSNKLESHIKSSVSDIQPFTLVLKGITGSVEQWGNYLFLNVDIGLNEVKKLSKNIYSGILEKYKWEFYNESYCPHMTVGKLRKDGDFEKALIKVNNETSEFKTIVNQVSVEIIGEDESSTIEMTVLL